ncbi:MAG: dual-specificity RNA methyltransferase RlmN [Planctomycetota bacterium]|jgi:23S rRNA (adenine2503-C2)-methyltransferase
MTTEPIDLLLQTPDSLSALLKEWGEPAFRSRQVCDWIFQKKVSSFEEMRNIPKSLRERLAAQCRLRSFAVREHLVSEDGQTEKWLFTTADKQGLETVLIREGERRTVCVSCALGCKLGCAFCATASGPYIRNLTVGEMVEQVVQVESHLGERVTNVVFMGMGEPFLNYEDCLEAARRMNAEEGLGIGARHITFSTVGVIPGIERFAAEPEDFRLALSLHAPSQKAREKIIPSAKKWELSRILKALRRYSRSKHREVTFEYILIDGFNAHPNDAEQLCELLSGIRCKVNCIPLNPWPGCTWSPPEEAACREFVRTVNRFGIRATLRQEKGRDIAAACGQLRAQRLEQA